MRIVSGFRFNGRMRFVLLAVTAVVAVAACSGGSGRTPHDTLLTQPVPSQVRVATRFVPGLGTILVDGRGHALYMFPPDAGSRVSCTGPCAGTWPPLVVSNGDAVRGAGQVNDEDLSTLADPNTGARIVTYSGYPLYRYAGDVRPGTADGQDLFLNGGPWYVLDPDGQPITTDGGGDS